MTDIRDRITGRIVRGVVLAEDCYPGECPRCGADEGQQCSDDDGTELGRWIHAERDQPDEAQS